MSKKLFFDTDCISAFLWVNNQSILSLLYPQGIVIPDSVYAELSNPCVRHLKDKIDILIANKKVVIEEMYVDSPSYNTFIELSSPSRKAKAIGKGEAAVIALAKECDGIVASNNLRDIKDYVIKYNLTHITTGDILVEALKQNIISEKDGNTIWKNMLEKRRKLGAASFTEYLMKISH